MTDHKKMLIIGLVWPEPTSSAAGTRLIQLVKLFINFGYQVTFASAATKSQFSFDLQSIGVLEQTISLNDSTFNKFVQLLKPQLVMYDRYITEEQYGWRVQNECPEAMTILDTEDLHFLRHARQLAAKHQQQLEKEDLYTDTAKREIAAILRCDLSLIISEREITILQDQFNIDPALLYYLPFLEDEISVAETKTWQSFERRSDFVFIGNFLHEPNWHTVQHLKAKIWPLISAKLPKAKLNIFGAYPSRKVLQLNNERENFHIMGRADDARQTIAQHRILLAPIQFGAGIKGKFIDAMQTGTPSVTTTIGAEAMKGDLEWSGIIEDQDEQLANEAVGLYLNRDRWLTAQQNGVRIINERYSAEKFRPGFNSIIQQTYARLVIHRQRNFFGQLLHHHSAQSTKYMSLWIEEKNKKVSE